MPTIIENLWPTDFDKVTQKTPVSILREQAQALGQRTANIVIGTVSSRTVPNTEKFEHILSLYASPLGYSTVLLTIDHGIELYPVSIRIPGDPRPLAATNSDEFAVHLKEIFSREKTKKTTLS